MNGADVIVCAIIGIKALQKKRAWNCDKDCAEYNREQAIDFIKSGRMQGYLAYVDNEVVGWCNANDKKAYDNVNFNFASYILPFINNLLMLNI